MSSDIDNLSESGVLEVKECLLTFVGKVSILKILSLFVSR